MSKKIRLEDSIRWIDIHDDPLYMLMPVWFFTFKYKDKPYTVLVNGQLGKVIGTMPWIPKRMYAIGSGVALGVMVVTFLLFWGSFVSKMFITPLPSYAFIGLMAASLTGLTVGISGIKRIKKNLKLTQSEDIFKFVKKRQE